MPKHSRAVENTWHIEMAARQDKPFNAVGGIDAVHELHIPRTREVRLPEPVTWQQGLNGRKPEGWEEPLIVAARTRERAAEMVLLAGTLGQP